ncbi:glycosyltransferase family 4 protein [Pseudoalteromonas sp. SWXJZ10B]|uniref:glycosyltransferase family 4 protein n=1 Tax=Pseudoalteromonas sp. SWXJZ10B TaxID=2792063 RepID=UPI0018CCCE0B|nr:glycosyltransferase family 4 protein [Pseudoalteromonas sp. SWXJZ10B]MBH0042054.1 glycosyltransferase family 4 protein [Pseudoalteromonas sp. SWXJZ10B]
MKKNVWYISKYANIDTYGADTRQASFCKEFAKAGHTVRLITSNSSHLYNSLPEFESRYKNMSYDGYEVTWVNTLKYTKATSINRILSWVWFEFFVLMMAYRTQYEKPDVVIASSLSILSVLSGCFYKRFYKAKFIFEVRDIWPQTLIDLKGFSHKHPLIWCLSKVEKLGYKYSDSIVGTMPGLKDHVENEVGLGCKVVSIPQGINLDFYTDNQKELSSDFIENYIPKNKFIVTYTGTMGDANALEYIVSAAKVLHLEQVTNVHFLLVGNGYLKDQLIEQAKGINNITFAPVIKKEQVQHVLELSNILVASVKNEKIYKYGISLNKFIDYMYAKKPVICMFSGYPSMINEANSGEFTPAEDVESFVDAIKKHQKMSAAELNELGENGYRFLVEQRVFSTLGSKFMELFK